MKHKHQAMWGIVLAASVLQFTVFAENKKVSPQGKASADLPNVFIIGDSISMGYTKHVKTLLKGFANVSRPPCNCAHSGVGVNSVQGWLGKTEWDVIHFNFGIWDTHCLYNGQLVRDRSKYKTEDLKRRYTTEQYVENLTAIVAILKKSGATLIWASTTPYVSYGEDTMLLLNKNNTAAQALMDNEGVMIDDLYSLTFPNLKEWQSGDGCHFNGQGYQQLAKSVASSISNALSEKAKGPKLATDK